MFANDVFALLIRHSIADDNLTVCLFRPLMICRYSAREYKMNLYFLLPASFKSRCTSGIDSLETVLSRNLLNEN
jgi:hypothetical protein